ncbi:MAG: GNAT family N-acetyltransferase [Luteitalea sp.]|nr:GNAT family N-acetyltransferase [Luteitalea sp.]
MAVAASVALEGLRPVRDNAAGLAVSPSSGSLAAPRVSRQLANGCTIRTGMPADAPFVHALIGSNLELGHLLPRTLGELEIHATRFSVIEREGRVVGCAELASLSSSVAEVRSLVVAQAARGQGLGTALVEELSARARREGVSTLCAFTHHPAHFVRLGFSIVPHVWLPEKIARDCTACAKFRTCGQYAVVLHPARTRAAGAHATRSSRGETSVPRVGRAIGARPLRMARAAVRVPAR